MNEETVERDVAQIIADEIRQGGGPSWCVDDLVPVARAAIAALPGWQSIETYEKWRCGDFVLGHWVSIKSGREKYGLMMLEMGKPKEWIWRDIDTREQIFPDYWMPPFPPVPAPPEEGHDPHLACPSWPGCDEAPLGCRLVTPSDQLEEYGHKD